MFSAFRQKGPARQFGGPARTAAGGAGFSLIEMLVVISIFLIITAVVMANMPGFRDKAFLQLIAQEISTTIRQAQVFGIGTQASGPSSFFSHGVFFDPNDSSGLGLDNKSFVLYVDKKNPQSTPPGVLGFSDEDSSSVIERFVINGAAEIKELCAVTDCSLATLDVFFQRFYPEANFPDLSNPDYVKIVLKSTRDDNEEREVLISNTGQISVNEP